MVPQVAVASRAGEPDAAQRAEQHVGECRKPQAQLIGPHGGHWCGRRTCRAGTP